MAESKKDKPLLDKAREEAEKLKRKAEETGKDLKNKAGEIVDNIGDKVGGLAEEVDEKSGFNLGKNKGLLIGGIVALFAMFGMESGIMPTLIAIAALVVGASHDKEGVFCGIFGGDKNDKNANGKELVKGKVGAGKDKSDTEIKTPNVPTRQSNQGQTR